MEKRKENKKKKWYMIGFLAALVLALGIVYAGWSVWKEYSTSILNIQKEQLLITVDSVASHLEHELGSYADDVTSLCDIAEYGRQHNGMDSVYNAFQSYASNKQDEIGSLVLRDGEGNVIWGDEGLSYPDQYGRYTVGERASLNACQGNDGELYFVFSMQSAGGLQPELAVSIRNYYEKLLSDIKIGTNGYFVVKTSRDIVLMHPKEEQWGMDVIEGREAYYGVEGLESLRAMIDKQEEGQTGVSEYESYWWEDETLPRVRKISAYTPAVLGQDFLVVSAVRDYEDIYTPIKEGFINIGMVFLALSGLFVVLLGIFSYLAIQKKKNQEEIEYLRDLNEVLRETRQSEEMIAHQQRLQIMGTMTGGIAHEFNNMLTPVMGYSDMLLDMLPADSEEHEYVREIFDASERAKDVIQQIASLSRRNMETVFSFIQVKKLLNRTLKMLHSVCPVNVSVTLDAAVSTEGFLGNETQMKQVILNLCMNAFHAIGKEQDGRVTIHASVEHREHMEEFHQIRAAREWDAYICVCISDNGCGMDQETMEQIFAPFFTTKKTGQGTGLGLSVAEQIIHSHKGYICVKSERGKGSDFYLYLPLLEEKDADRLKPDPAAGAGEMLMKVLIVDDNEKVLHLLEKAFERMKIKVSTAETPEGAKAVLEQEAFGLVLIDQTIGENHSGVNFAMSIRNRYPDMVRFLMVDQVKKETVEAVQQEMIDDYVEKPVAAAEIIRKMRERRGGRTAP